MRSRRVSLDVVIAAGLFGVGVVLYLSGLFSLGTERTDVPLAVRLVLLAALCLVGCARRARPGAALALGTVLFAVDLVLGPSVPVWIVLADLLYAAVRHGSPRVGRAATYATGIGVVVLAGVVLAAEHDVRPAAGALVVSALFFGTSLWWGLAIKRQVELTDIERERARAHRILADRDREAAVAEERNAMARDLHDVIAGHLSSIAIHSTAALSRDVDPAVRESLSAIRTGSTAALTEMRAMIDVLHADAADPAVAPPRLADLHVVVDAARATGTDVSVDLEVGDLPTVVDHAAYRIVHEAVVNAMKHAARRPIDVAANRTGTALRLIVRNDLDADSDETRRVGRGLANMKHRAQLLGGDCSAGPCGGHWVVRAHLPVGSAS
ncbi:sensor histidine kinase [Rhodococcoides corynebacterioides]|uniref:histidine kinase n=1 Tax=Rhodococcoides corynebacterioides TaxID=53972 RepID=A0ABS7P590_9NOCA|nr:histidine kinase [Rhodococcus corynebacterioides]MBY6367553.1 sensor histidine kinase [Rhodococcus corynebacterioides]MBY6407853.1 sensor histidine kinase [Rhodococcus corynebacterioides]